MALLAYDAARLDSLRIAMGAALNDLQRVRSDDAASAAAMQAVRSASRSLGEVWLPRVSDVVCSKAMTAPAAGDPLWQIIDDSDAAPSRSSSRAAWMNGPEWPGSRSFGEVWEAIASGTLHPMPAPVDANGRAGAHYTSLAIAGGSPREIGHADLTSGMEKFADFMSDGLPIAWRETEGLTIIYLNDALVTRSVHVLSAYDRDSGPETLTDQTTEATVSGYLVLTEESSLAQVSVQIGPGEQDPTQSFPIISESSSGYSGVFYPDDPPELQPVSREPRFVNPPSWTFTTSASPMVDGWGTWGV
jgi:hypothetical protein